MIHQTDKTTNTKGFEQEAVQCIRRAQSAMVDLLDGAGLAEARPIEVGRVLGLDKTLAWKLSRFARASDMVKAVRHVPGNGGIEITLRAAAAKGLSQKHVDAVRDANEQLREFVRKQAGDRRSFEAMIAAGGRDQKVEFEERRDFYRAGSAIWGVRARAQMLSLFLRPSQVKEGRIDVVQLSGLIDFERLRADVPWIIRRLWVSDKTENTDPKFIREPLDPSGATGNALPLIPEFCTKPLPELNQFEGGDGVLYDEIAPGKIGRRGAVTCITGEVYHSAFPSERTEHNTFGRYELYLRTPVEYAQFDVYLHESLTHFGDFEQGVYGLMEDRPGVGAGKTHEHPLYPIKPATRLGYPAVLRGSPIGNYAEMVDGALDRAGWEGHEHFRGYRVGVEYPATPWCVTMTCPINP